MLRQCIVAGRGVGIPKTGFDWTSSQGSQLAVITVCRSEGQGLDQYSAKLFQAEGREGCYMRMLDSASSHFEVV